MIGVAIIVASVAILFSPLQIAQCALVPAISCISSFIDSYGATYFLVLAVNNAQTVSQAEGSTVCAAFASAYYGTLNIYDTAVLSSQNISNVGVLASMCGFSQTVMMNGPTLSGSWCRYVTPSVPTGIWEQCTRSDASNGVPVLCARAVSTVSTVVLTDVSISTTLAAVSTSVTSTTTTETLTLFRLTTTVSTSTSRTTTSTTTSLSTTETSVSVSVSRTTTSSTSTSVSVSVVPTTEVSTVSDNTETTTTLSIVSTSATSTTDTVVTCNGTTIDSTTITI